jgi:hypothetical protein
VTGTPSEPGPVRPAVALALAAVTFVALAIAGLGMTALFLDADVIAVRGLGQIPGIVGMLLATAAFAGVLWSGLRLEHPSFWTAPVAGLAAALGEVVGVFLGALVSGADAGAAAAASGGIAVGWPGVVIALAGLVSALGAVALVRRHAARPRWPWEGDEEE